MALAARAGRKRRFGYVAAYESIETRMLLISHGAERAAAGTAADLIWSCPS